MVVDNSYFWGRYTLFVLSSFIVTYQRFFNITVTLVSGVSDSEQTVWICSTDTRFCFIDLFQV